ncbi:uncharacterized protein LOC134241155 [Saccostrea cucullata]|uniref:uncharacterized protein LOC134241155 n=1 Tax=Saccostrea cuccullata TaxID=36930 RepID=UPI002ED0268E
MIKHSCLISSCYILDCSNEYLVPNSFLPCPDNCCCCQREKGECHLCENENEGPQCELDNAHDEPDWQFRFYVVVGTFLGSVTLNTFLLALLCLKRNRRKKMNVHKMITEVPNPLLNEANVIYDNPDGYVVGDYQELEALRVSSLYDSLQQQRDEGPDLRNEK